MSWQRSKHITKQSLKWLHWTLVLPALLLILCLGLLLYTAPGLRLNLWLAQSLVEGLSVADSKGSVLGGNQLFDVRYQQDGISVSLKHIELVVNNRCLLTLEACIDTLMVDQLTVKLSPSKAASSDKPTDTTPFWLPFPLSINQFTVANAKLELYGQHAQWQHFSTGIKVWGNKAQLLQPQLQQLDVTLSSNNAADSDDSLAYTPLQLNDFTLPLSLFVEQFRLTSAKLRQNGATQHVDSLAFSVQWQQQQLNVTEFEMIQPKARLQAALNINTFGRYPLTAWLQAQLHDGVLSEQQLKLDAKGDLSALQLSATSSGPITATLSATLDLTQPQLPHQLQLTSSQLVWPLQSSTPALTFSAAKLQLSGDLTRSSLNGQFNLDATSAPGARTVFNGYASLSGVTLDKLLIETLGGAITSAISIDWQHGLSWQSQTRLTNIQPEQYWPQYNGKLSGEFNHSGQLSADNSWQLNISALNLNGVLRQYQLALNGALQLSDATGNGDFRLSTEQLRIHHADNIINIAGQLQQDWALNVQLTVPALEQTVAGANGAVQGKFSLSGPRNHPRLEGNVQANSLRYQQYELAELALDTKLWLSRDNTLNTELELTARDGRAAHQQLEQLTLSLSGNERQHQLSAAVISAEQQIELKLSGALSDDRQQWQGQLQQAEFGSLFGPWQLAEAASIRYSRPQNQLQLSAHCWQQQASNLCLTKPLIVSQQQASAALQLKQFNLATLAPLLPLRTGLTGQADATLSVNWQRGTQPEASLTLQSDGGQLTQQLDTPLQLDWQYLRLNTTLSDDNLHSTLQLNFVEQATLNANIQIANLQQGDRQLSGTVQLEQLAMQVLQPLIGEFSELQGQLSSNVQVSGQLASPELKGDLTLEQLRIKGKTAPLDVDDAKIVLNFAGQQAQLNGLVKTPQGEINLSGDASWQQLADWQATLKITGDELRLQVPQARLQVAPDLTLSATPKLTQLRGTVTIPVATITIDSLSDDAVELSDDLVLLNAQLEPVAQEDKSLFRFKTDIKVVLGNKVKLSAFGLKTRLSGNLRVRQQPRQVLRLNGDVSLQDGTFRAYGQDLLIRKGKMNFNGPADQPFLNIEAIRNPDNMEDDVIAGIRVTGPADAPNVVIFSEPAKPQANALSYLLMGRDLDSDAGNTGNAVTTGLIGMTLSSSSKVVGEIGEAFGLQDLTLDTAGAGDNSQVTVSGYLSRDLQLKYGYGIFNAVGEFTLRYRLMRRLYLEAVSGVDNAVDVLYKFEFD